MIYLSTLTEITQSPIPISMSMDVDVDAAMEPVVVADMSIVVVVDIDMSIFLEKRLKRDENESIFQEGGLSQPKQGLYEF